MKKPHIAVIGGGASGLTAAIVAARHGCSVTLLERQERIGRKLLATGNGRCNLTNLQVAPDHYHGADPAFAEPVLRQFSLEQTLDFFHDLGVCTRVEESTRVYPVTGQASTILDVLRFEIERLGITVRVASAVEAVQPVKNGFRLQFAEGMENADRVIVAGGGKAMPQLGGSDQGLRLLTGLGHRLEPVYPALVPLKAGTGTRRGLKGVKAEGRARLVIDGESAAETSGEILFTEYGLSGPPVIQLSLAANAAARSGSKQEIAVVLDLFPAMAGEELAGYLVRRLQNRPDIPLETVLIGLTHKRLLPALLREAGLSGDRPAGEAAAEASRTLTPLLKNWIWPVNGSLSWNEAHVMGGGIATTDFSPETLESKLAQGLFAAGEVLDVTGDCGGFNLQWAWSSGFVAGTAAARS